MGFHRAASALSVSICAGAGRRGKNGEPQSTPLRSLAAVVTTLTARLCAVRLCDDPHTHTRPVSTRGSFSLSHSAVSELLLGLARQM